jgi:Family of unknown function (DUF6241)
MNKKKIIITFSIIAISILCVWGAYSFGFNNVLGLMENKPTETQTVEQPSDTSDNTVEAKSDKEILDAMHSMANTLIVPEDGQIWGKEPITKEKLTGLISSVTNSTISSKDELLAILNRWNSGDFTSAVDDHNKVWKLLDGTIGKAISVNEDGVKETIATLSSN